MLLLLGNDILKAFDLVYLFIKCLIKKLSIEESYRIIKDWLDKCNDIKRLDNYRNFEYRISCALKTANKKQIPPMSYNTLKENYKDLYSIVIKQKD